MQRMPLWKWVLVWGLAGGFVTGCTDYRVNDEYNIEPAHLSPEALAEVPDRRVCEAYAKNRSQRLKAELERREVFTDLEWQAIETRTPILGISEMALMTAMPGIARTRSWRSNGVLGKEWYCAKQSDQFVKVRTENGKVVWFRNSWDEEG